MVVNGLISRLNEHRYFTVGYADDITILVSGIVTSTICELTQHALKIVERWCREYELSVNPAKTELVMFTHKRTLGPHKLPKLFGTELRTAQTVKYLGVTLDSKLNWNQHLDNTVSKATITFWQCKRMIGKTWGLSPKITTWLYTTIIRPIASYGAIVWWPKAKQTTGKSKLQKVQRLACLATTGSMRTTPTAALEVLLNLPPLHLFIIQEAAATAQRLRNNQCWVRTRGIHTTILGETIEEYPLLVAPSDIIPKEYIFDKKYRIALDEDVTLKEIHKELSIYTDGSKTNQGSGAGVFSEELNIHISAPLGKLSTIFQAECVGIILASLAISAREITNTGIRIYTDSMSVLQALNSTTYGSGLILECHTRLNSVSVNNSVTLQWIKGHSNSRGNDAADQLAREGSGMCVLGPEPILPLPGDYGRALLRKRTRDTHEQEWYVNPDCKQSKLALPTLNPKLTRKVLKLTRPKLRTLTAAITGHGHFNKHLYTLGITDSPLCRACLEVDETAKHMLLECEQLATYRRLHLGSPSTIQEATRNLRGLIGFLEELNWY